MIAHGHFTYTIPPHSGWATNFRAAHQATGEVLEFDGDYLKKLYHDISHLTADLTLTVMKIGSFEGFLIPPLSDTEILRVLPRDQSSD